MSTANEIKIMQAAEIRRLHDILRYPMHVLWYGIDLAENISTKQEAPMPIYERKWHNFANGHAEYTKWERLSEADVKKALARSKLNPGLALDELDRGYEIKLPLFSLRIKPRDLP